MGDEKGGWPSNVGILAMELYFPRLFVSQSDLEQYDGVSTGKYTVGLGQNEMGVATDLEDVNSVCLTVASRLMQRYKVRPESLGRVEVGTESQVDKSKSVKSQLMQLFVGKNAPYPIKRRRVVNGSGDVRTIDSDVEHDVSDSEDDCSLDVEGVDCVNACYGGTQAVFNAVNWCESSAAADGRLALVVLGDIAVYAPGPARCTGGAGACAMLIGPGASVVLDRGVRSTSMCHSYDFYKPTATNCEYAMFDGAKSVIEYTRALDTCYRRFTRRYEQLYGEHVTLDSFSAALFHSPYCRLVEKSLARMKFTDWRAAHRRGRAVPKNASVPLSTTYGDRDFARLCTKAASADFARLTQPTLHFSQHVGNMYTPSVYAALVTLLAQSVACDRRVLLFSYGSGSCASLFSLRIIGDAADDASLCAMRLAALDALDALQRRRRVTPEQFTQLLKQREVITSKPPIKPQTVPGEDVLFPNSYYLCEIDAEYRRFYALFQPEVRENGEGLVENGVLFNSVRV